MQYSSMENFELTYQVNEIFIKDVISHNLTPIKTIQVHFIDNSGVNSFNWEVI